MWTAARINYETANRMNVAFRVIGRLKPGVTLEQAQERIDALTDAEVRDLAAHFDDKAAGGVIEVILLAALVVVILELVGVTDIFPQF